MSCLVFVNSYLCQKSRVSWCNHLSQYYILPNEVQQGGVLSPKLLLRVTLVILEYRYQRYMYGALSYANDITLLTPSLRELSEMLHIGSMYAGIFDITL